MLTLHILAACGDQDQFQGHAVGGDDVDQGDTTPPTIAYTQEADWAYLTDDFVVTATITDEESSIYIASLNFKQETGQWDSQIMMGDANGVYSATIQSEDLGSAGLYYYIEAVDTAQNVALAPDEGEAAPFHIRLSE